MRTLGCSLERGSLTVVAPNVAPTAKARTSSYVPWASTAATRAVMQANRKRDTRPELALRRAVHRLGLRYRIATRPIKSVPRTADLVFAGAHVAVFVDGCFWHACPVHFKPPSTNVDYWRSKIERNLARAVSADDLLHRQGWNVLHVWEHEDSEIAAREVARVVQSALVVRLSPKA